MSVATRPAKPPVAVAATVVAALIAVAMVAGCAAHVSADSPSTVTPTTASTRTDAVPGCLARDLPAGFSLDRAHSGGLTASAYSESGDMQAAMIYDGYQSGVRQVFTNLDPQPAGGSDLVIECTILQFHTPSGAVQFLAAYKALRDEAGKMAVAQTPVASVGTTTLQYAETGQAFAGYKIASTDVAELASQLKNRFYSVAVAGPSPSPQLASVLLRDLVAGAA